METETLNLLNLCDGAAVEVFEREMQEVLNNIADVSTPSDAKRQITLTFDITPFPDRKGAHVAVSCKGKLSGVAATAGTIFISKQAGGVRAYIEDPRQEALFAKTEPSTDAKQ